MLAISQPLTSAAESVDKDWEFSGGAAALATQCPSNEDKVLNIDNAITVDIRSILSCLAEVLKQLTPNLGYSPLRLD